MTNKEREIYENAIRARKDLVQVAIEDVISDIEKSMVNDDNIIELENHQIFMPNLVSEITFTGEVTFEADTHEEEDWDDNFGAIAVDVIDKVYDCVLKLDGKLTAKCGNEIKVKTIKY